MTYNHTVGHTSLDLFKTSTQSKRPRPAITPQVGAVAPRVTLSKTGRKKETGGCPYRVGGAVQVTVGGRARGHLAAVGCQGEVDDTAQSLAILILHSLSAGCHGYLSICPPIWRGWSLGRHPGKKKKEGGREGR